MRAARNTAARIAAAWLRAARERPRITIRATGATLAAMSPLLATIATAQPAPAVTKVEPPTWWAGHAVNPVRLLVRGTALTGATLDCAPLRCGDVTVNAAGTYVFVDVTIPRGTSPGAYPLRLATRGGTATVDFRILDTLPTAGRYQGFGPDDAFYLAMPDRFANGDPSNDDPAVSRGLLDRTKGRYYHGGDIAGLRARLPYLRDLGITALWLNPLYQNNDRLNERETYDGQAITDYHGYGAVDFYAVEEHFGTMDDVRAFVDDAHAHGIKVVFDLVANHSGPYHPWVQDPPTPTWYNGTEAQHLSNTWQVWTLADPHATAPLRAGVLEGWFGGFLPDFNQLDPEVSRYHIQNTLWWVAMTGIDGIRQDTWPYVPRVFWRDWMDAIRRAVPTLTVVGEVFDGDPALVSFFQGGRAGWDGLDTKVDALFDFPSFFPARNAFARGGPLRELAMMMARDHLYPDPSRLVTFIGLHDVERFMNERGATPAGLRLAFTWLLTARGIPLVYYGDEIAMPGGNDPDNRRDFPGGWPDDPRDAFTEAGRTAEEQATFAHVRRLLRLRAARADLRHARMENLRTDEQLWVYRRGRSYVALNNDTTPVVVTLPAPDVGADALGVCAAPRVVDGVSIVTVPARAGCVF